MIGDGLEWINRGRRQLVEKGIHRLSALLLLPPLPPAGEALGAAAFGPEVLPALGLSLHWPCPRASLEARKASAAPWTSLTLGRLLEYGMAGGLEGSSGNWLHFESHRPFQSTDRCRGVAFSGGAPAAPGRSPG